MLIAAALPALAQAADFTAEVSADNLKYAWTGTGSGVPPAAVAAPCGSPGHDCDFVKLNIVHPGDLDIVIDFSEGGESVEGEASVPDLDASFYKAGADGEPEGDSLTGTECGGSSLVEKCTAKGLAPGKYVVEVSFFTAADAVYKGEVTLKTDVPPTPPAAPAAPPAEEPAPPPPPAAPAQSHQPPPPAQPYNADPPKSESKPKKKKSKKAKRAACNKKAKKIKNKSKRRKALKRCARRYR